MEEESANPFYLKIGDKYLQHCYSIEMRMSFANFVSKKEDATICVFNQHKNAIYTQDTNVLLLCLIFAIDTNTGVITSGNMFNYLYVEMDSSAFKCRAPGEIDCLNNVLVLAEFLPSKPLLK
jgi:hypothetical protein